MKSTNLREKLQSETCCALLERWTKVFVLPTLLPVLLALTLLLSACTGGGEVPTGQTAPSGPVSFEGEAVVYVVGPMSGLEAERGQAQTGGARLAAEELNAAGGVLRHKIVVKALDDRGTPEGALAAAQLIVKSRDRVIGVIIHEGSDPEFKAVKEVYSEHSVLVVAASSSNPMPASIDDPRFLCISANNESQASQAANLLKRLNRTRAAVVHTATPYGQTLASTFEEAVKELGLELVASVEIEPEGLSYSSVAGKIKEVNADGIFFAGEDVEAVVLLADLYGVVFRGVFIAADHAFTHTVVDELGCKAEGIYAACVLPDPKAVMGGSQLAAYASMEFREPGLYSVAGYSGVEVLARAFERANSWDATAAGRAARDLNVDTLIGNVSYDAQGKLAKPRIYFFQVSGGRYGQALASIVR